MSDGASEEDHAGVAYLPLFWNASARCARKCRAQFARLAREGGDSHAAASRLQMRLFRLAHAHVERVVLEQFRAGVARCDRR